MCIMIVFHCWKTFPQCTMDDMFPILEFWWCCRIIWYIFHFLIKHKKKNKTIIHWETPDLVRITGSSCSSLENHCSHLLWNQDSPCQQDMGWLVGSFCRLWSDNEVTLHHPYMLFPRSPSPFTFRLWYQCCQEQWHSDFFLGSTTECL